MKTLICPILFLFFPLAMVAQTPCNGGSAGPYDCNGYDLQSEIGLSAMNASSGNDSWGWTDPNDGKEYAIVGLNNGTAFIDISTPTSPVYLGKLPTHTSSSSWRDVKVYNNHAFVVSEAGGHGMQVFDLTRLRNVSNPPETFTEDAHYGGFGSAHNIVINEDTGYAYPVGAGPYNGGPIFINIQNPTNPIGEGGYGMDSYSHDAQIVTYNGPDTDYQGREILIGSNENEVIIADITDKANPVNISTVSYSNVGYTHQGWFTEDQRYFLLGDETDEQNFGFDTRTIVFDFTDLDNPQFDFSYTGPTAAIDHNGYTKGDKFYLANYRAGLRVLDLSDISNGNITEEGFFDSYPGSNSASFSGVWSVYPYFASGNIVMSDMNRGFILTKAANPDTTPPVAVCQSATLTLNANGVATLDPASLDGGSTDNNGSVFFSVSKQFFDCSDLGDNTVTLIVSDNAGNMATCTTTVTVTDENAPIVSCPADIEVLFDTGQTFYTVPDYVTAGDITAEDNCSTSLTITQDPPAGTQLTQGNYFITFETTDDSSNVGSCSFQLAVEAPLGINENTLESGLSIFPNPTSDIIHIASKNVAINSVQIIDMLGKTFVQSEGLSLMKTQLNVSQLTSGIYFVVINDQVSKKIVKK